MGSLVVNTTEQIVLHTELRAAQLFEINVVRRDPVTSIYRIKDP